MAKINKKRGLGRGLDSLIPNIEEDNEEKIEGIKEEQEIDDITEELKDVNNELEKENDNVEIITEEIIKEKAIEENLESGGEIIEEINDETEVTIENFELRDYEIAAIDEVKEIIAENPRITLWSAKSSAVFRYLRKTRPEFSISKEASELIDKAVSEKYPEIWEYFEDIK